jgi:hypothetical protein
MRKLATTGAALLLMLGVFACGGGDDGGSSRDTVPTATPAKQISRTSQPRPPAEPTDTAEPYNPDPYAGFPTFSPEATKAPPNEPAITQPWRVYSARIFYDEGGGGDVSNTITTPLNLSTDGSWSFSDSSGTWSAEPIADDDWTRWGIQPYGPSTKIVLDGWSAGAADGPIEEAQGGGADFIWVIYREGPPAIGAPGTVWMKFGQS